MDGPLATLDLNPPQHKAIEKQRRPYTYDGAGRTAAATGSPRAVSLSPPAVCCALRSRLRVVRALTWISRGSRRLLLLCAEMTGSAQHSTAAARVFAVAWSRSCAPAGRGALDGVVHSQSCHAVAAVVLLQRSLSCEPS
jgi:hypothetical protein